MMETIVCRICLFKNGDNSIENHHCIRLWEMKVLRDIYQNMTGIKVQIDDAVNTICENCKSLLEHFNEFRLKCIESDAFLRLKSNIKPVKEEVKSEDVIIEELEPGEAIIEAGSPQENIEYEHRKCVIENDTKKYIYRKCGKKFVKLKALSKHEKKHGHKSLVFCELCGVRLSSKRALKTHKIFKHSENRPFACTLCTLTFKAKSGLDEHMAVRHNKERNFSCDICSWTSKSLKTLKRHIMRVHLTEKTVPCNICHVKFKDKKTLDQHFLIHTDIRPFVCDKCSRGFAQISSLSKHIKICGQKGKVRSQPIKCDDCIKRLATTQTLVNHRLKCHKDLYRNWTAAKNGIKFVETDLKLE